MKYDLQALRGDVFGGITSAVVGLPRGAGLRRRVRPGSAGRHIRGNRGGFLRGGVRWDSVSGIRSHRPDGRGDGGHRHQSCRQPRRGIHDCHYGGSYTDSSGRTKNRSVRILHTVLGYIRGHVRHRHNHHSGTHSAVPGRARHDGRTGGSGPRAARSDRRGEPQHARHRGRHPCRRRGLAGSAQEVSPAYPWRR